jgi:hypothetical protein
MKTTILITAFSLLFMACDSEKRSGETSVSLKSKYIVTDSGLYPEGIGYYESVTNFVSVNAGRQNEFTASSKKRYFAF